MWSAQTESDLSKPSVILPVLMQCLCAPSFAYKIDTTSVDKAGLVNFPDIAGDEFEIENLLAFLVEKALGPLSFTMTNLRQGKSSRPAGRRKATADQKGLTIAMPPENFIGNAARLGNL